MKVKLSVMERLLAMGILPSEDNITSLRIVRKAKELLGFTEEEHKLLNFRIENNSEGKSVTRWENKVEEKEFELGDKTIDMLSEMLKKLNDHKKLTEAHITLWEKLVENGPKD